MVRCCQYQDQSSSQSLYDSRNGCKWVYSNWYGKSANCGEGYVMTGSCGSGARMDCPGYNVHGAYCCKTYQNSGKNVTLQFFLCST